MSRTYKFPRSSLENFVMREEPKSDFRIQKKLERQKQLRKKRARIASLKKNLRFGDRQRTRG